MSLSINGTPLINPDVTLANYNKVKVLRVSEAPEQVYKKFIMTQEKFLELRHSSTPDTSSNPAYQEYAKVKVNGKVVTKIDNHGWTETSNALSGNMLKGLPDSVNGNKAGPVLAQARAEYIAELLGGEVVKSSTALTQSQFGDTPRPKTEVDFKSLRNDPLYEQLQQIKLARTSFLTRKLRPSFNPSPIENSIIKKENEQENKEQVEATNEK